MNELYCPDDGTKLEREYGISGVLSICPKCGKEWVKCLGKLVSRDEFHNIVEAWK